MSNRKPLSLSSKIFISMILAVVAGMVLNMFFAESAWVDKWLTGGLFHVVGQIFINLLKMLVVPLVFVSLICGIGSISDPAKLGRVSGKAMGLYLFTTAIAVTSAIAAALIIKPGIGANPVATAETTIASKTFVEVLIDIVPSNPVAAMAEGKMLPIILFAVLLGLAMTYAGEPGKRISGFFQDMNEVIMKLVTLVMKLAPYGVFALITILVATTGWETLKGVLKYILLVISMLIIHGIVVYPLLLSLIGRLNPRMFLAKMRATMLFAFSVSSSNATIPVTMKTVEDRMGVNNKVASFTVPLGATINMDGTAIMQGIATGFIAQYYGIDLSIGEYLVVIMMVIMASIGAAGVPSVGVFMLAGVFAQVGLPADGIAIIFGVDRLLDMTRTAVNVTGDAAVTTIVAKSEGELDLEVFNDPDAGLIYAQEESKA